MYTFLYNKETVYAFTQRARVIKAIFGSCTRAAVKGCQGHIQSDSERGWNLVDITRALKLLLLAKKSLFFSCTSRCPALTLELSTIYKPHLKLITPNA